MEITKQIKDHLEANMNMSKKDIIVGNLLGGIFWGIGSVIGAIVVVGILGYILKSLGVFSTIGGFFNQLLDLNQQLRQMPKF